MKLFAAIFAIYILLLSWVPCCAYGRCRDDHHTEQAGREQHDDGCEDNDCGTCSPFFCHACAGCVITTFRYEPAPVMVGVERVYNAIVREYSPQYVPKLDAAPV